MKKSTRANPTGREKQLKNAMVKSNAAQSQMDSKADKKAGIKENSKKDKKLDAKLGKKPSLVIAITTKKKK